MNIDLILQIRKQGLLKKRRIRIIAPPNRVETEAGTLVDPGKGVWSPEGAYSEGEFDVQPVSEWVRKCVGDPIRDVIRQEYPCSKETRLRVLVSATEDLISEMMTVPWELLEGDDFSQGIPYGEQISIVRVLHHDDEGPDPLVAGFKLKVAVIWANPDPANNISDLPEHLEQLTQIIQSRPQELTLVGPLEFTSAQELHRELEKVHPHVIYYIGHAEDRGAKKIALLIGPRGNPVEYSVADFRALLEETGPPRLLILNACAGTIGYNLNPYLGAALSFAENVEGVVTMQTKVPVRVAMRFAQRLFRSLTNGRGLAESVKDARYEIQRGQSVNRSDTQSFEPYMPVLLQRTRRDQLFNIDLTGRELQRVLFTLKEDMERLALYFNRSQDAALLKLFEDVAGSPVSVVSGPSGTGKSTSVRQAIYSLLTSEVFRQGRRYLYYQVRAGDLSAGDENAQIHQLLLAFVNHFPWLTADLKKQLLNPSVTKPEHALATLASWLHEEESDGRSYYICLDHLPSPLAASIAKRASAMLEGGHLMLVAEEPEIDPNQQINRVTFAPMTLEEIQVALGKQENRPVTINAQQILEYSNGLPYFVMLYINRGVGAPSPVGELAAKYFEHREVAISAAEANVLRFAAVCEIPIPAPLLESLFPADVIQTLVEEYLLARTEADAYRLPDGLREYFKPNTVEELLGLHETATNEFSELAERSKSSQAEARFQLATRWYREAFRHALSIVQLLGADERDAALQVLESARALAEKLHNRYLDQGDEVGMALSLWEQFQNAAYSLGAYGERSADVHLADCLIRTGEYEKADALLEQVTLDNIKDEIQLSALFLRSNLIKALGERDRFPRRIELLQEALALAGKLNESDHSGIKDRIADLEHALGNALGFGQEANPELALKYLKDAQQHFEETGNYLQSLRSVSEQIEIKRYNGLLTAEERAEAIKTLRENARSLITRAMRYDAVLHLYELGRLDPDAAQRAEWFRQAFTRAGDSYQPLNWHAAIRWCMARVEHDPISFQTVAPELEHFSAKLRDWLSSAWSRRVLRGALIFLAEGYESAGDKEKALTFARECWQVVSLISKFGEGRKDRIEKVKVARLYGGLALQQNSVSEARSVAGQVAGEASVDLAAISTMDETALKEFFLTKVTAEVL